MAQAFVPLMNIGEEVREALAEDVGGGDISAALLPNGERHAKLITRQAGVVCGQAWAQEVLRQVDNRVRITWQVSEGQWIEADTDVAVLSGPVRSLVTAERTLMNFLQLLSGVATKTHRFVQAVSTTKAKIFDTRKTLPTLRLAQKYAVNIGGGQNHRMGLFDAYLLKENHLLAFGSIASMVEAARQQHPSVPLIVEVESLRECQQAVEAGVDVILLDNFSLETMAEAVKEVAGRVLLEASGNINLETVLSVAQTGVDRISIGDLTKNIEAMDLSMRLLESE